MGAKELGQEITKPIQLERTKPIQACIYTSHKHAYTPLILDVIQRKTKDFYISHIM